MNKKLLHAACFCLPLFVPIGSCETPDYEIETPENPIHIQVSDLETTCQDDLMGWVGNVPTEGATFTVTVTSEKGLEQMHAADIDNYYTYTNERPPFSDFSMFWGKMTFLTKEEPYRIEVTINPNDTNKNRTIRLCFGESRYSYVQLYINQPPKSYAPQN